MTGVSRVTMYAQGRGRILAKGFRGVTRGPRLAIRMAVIVCALASQSCLVPQSVDPIGEPAHPPPHFVLESIPSYMLAPVLHLDRQGTVDGACHCVLEIPQLTVHEDDPTVELQVRWFVDYDLSVPRSQSPWPGATWTLPANFNDPTYTERTINKFAFDPDTGGIHVVEVVVGETAGFDDSPTVPLLNRTMKPGFTLALYRFVIDVNLQQITGSCANIPSVLVCQ